MRANIRGALVSSAVGVVALLIVAVLGGAPSWAAGRSGDSHATRPTVARCAKAIFGLTARAEPVPGSADHALVARYAVLRTRRSAGDAIPSASLLRRALGTAGARTFDPSASVRLRRTGRHIGIYAVPAKLGPLQVPAGCASLPRLKGLDHVKAFAELESGSGAGICLISTSFTTPSSSGLPGQAAPKRRLTVVGASCESKTVLDNYVGTLGQDGGGSPMALVPDGVASLSYTFADGRKVTASVSGNLVAPPSNAQVLSSNGNGGASTLGQRLRADLPTRVTETRADGGPGRKLTRPSTLIPTAVKAVTVLRRVVSVLFSDTTSVDTSDYGAVCRARTHRCVGVTVTMKCAGIRRCTMYRTIHRYRYVTKRPPAGTSGPDTLATEPIVGRVNRYVARPRKLFLALQGNPHRRVTVLLDVDCVGRNSSDGTDSPPLRVTVPSRTRVGLPGPGRSYRACDVSALVVSARRTPVRTTVLRG